jgi:hypothetical protein
MSPSILGALWGLVLAAGVVGVFLAVDSWQRRRRG